MRLGATVTGQTRMVAPGGIELPATALTTVDNKPAVWVVDPQVSRCRCDPSELQRQESSSIVVTQRARRRRAGGDRRRARAAARPEGALGGRQAMNRFNLVGLGDRAPLDRLLPDAGARRDRHRLLHAARAQRGPHLHHQDHGGAGAMAGRDAGGHAAAGHRTHRAQAAGDASPRLPEKLHQGGAIDGLRVPQGIDRAERRCRIPGTRFARRSRTSS